MIGVMSFYRAINAAERASRIRKQKLSTKRPWTREILASCRDRSSFELSALRAFESLVRLAGVDAVQRVCDVG